MGETLHLVMMGEHGGHGAGADGLCPAAGRRGFHGCGPSVAREGAPVRSAGRGVRTAPNGLRGSAPGSIAGARAARAPGAAQGVARAFSLVVVLASLVAVVAQPAAAQGRTELDGLGAVRRACGRARRPGRRLLYSIIVPAGRWTFGGDRAEDGLLRVGGPANLSALGGAVELVPSGLEDFGFVARPAQAETMRAQQENWDLRVGFFIGFDNHDRSLCLLRPAAGVSIIRADIAFVELLDSSGAVAARQDTERLRAWLDDADRDGIPGSGPRAAIAGAVMTQGSTAVPDRWTTALAAQGAGALGAALSRCHAAGVQRGANADGQVVVRLEVDSASGRIRAAAPELSTLGDDEESNCLAAAFPAHARLSARNPPADALSILSVTVRVASDPPEPAPPP